MVVGGVSTGSSGSRMCSNESPMSVNLHQPRSGLSTSPTCSVKVTVVVGTDAARIGLGYHRQTEVTRVE
jgi:hypothetical protein